MMNPASEDIKDLLAAESSLALTFATNLFIAKMPIDPDLCVSVNDTGGYDPEVDYVYDRPTVQIQVRGPKGDYIVGHELAQDIGETIHGVNNQTVNATRYIGIWREGDVIALGFDDNDRPLFSINFRIHRTDT